MVVFAFPLAVAAILLLERLLVTTGGASPSNRSRRSPLPDACGAGAALGASIGESPSKLGMPVAAVAAMGPGVLLGVGWEESPRRSSPNKSAELS